MFLSSIPTTELNDFARLLANVLRDFDPDTIFWSSQSPIVFPNYDVDGFAPPQAARKSFGVQTLLETFARSTGFKTYKSMLTKAPQYSSIDLSDLNPYPRNVYYSCWWRCFISSIVTTTFEDWNAKTVPSYLTYRNFKRNELSHIAPFLFQNVPFLKNREINPVFGGIEVPFEDDLPLYDQNRIIPVHYFPIAMSMLLTAQQIGLDRPIPLREFLVHEKWYEADFDHFTKQLNLAFGLYLNMGIKITIDENDLLNSEIKFDIPYQFNLQIDYAKSVYALREKLKNLVTNKLQLISGDTGYYTHPQVNAAVVTKTEFPSHELRCMVLGEVSKTGSLAHQVIYGTKAFWLNQAMVLMLQNQQEDKRVHTLLKLDDAALEQKLDTLILDQLKPYTPPAVVGSTIERKPYSYHFYIKGTSRFKMRFKQKTGLTVKLPESLTIYSDFLLPKEVARLAAQGELIKLFPKGEVHGLDYYDCESKYLGDPSILEFDGKMKLTLKQVDHFPNNLVAEMSADFDLRKIIRSIRFERCGPTLLTSNDYRSQKPYTESSDTVLNFDEMSSSYSYQDFIFAVGADDKDYRACHVYLNLIDTPYVDSEQLDPISGWNNVDAMCQWDTQGEGFDKIELSVLLDLGDRMRPGREKGLSKFLDFLQHNDQFKALMQSCLDYSIQKWNERDWYKDQGTEFLPLFSLYHTTEYETKA